MFRFLKIFVVCFCLMLLSGCIGVRVRKGDTLYSISKKNDVPMRAIIERNGLKPPYTLSVGQYLYFPKEKNYRVRRGDTLYSIASRYEISVSYLAKINNIREPYTIKSGQVLKIASWSDEKPIFTEKDKMKSNDKLVVQSDKASPQSDRAEEKKRRQAVKNPTSFKGNANVPKAQSKKRFKWPVKGKIASDFGNGNDGINILGKAGTAVGAADSGTIAYAGNELKGYGNLILIRHKDGWITAYAHNQKLLVKKGDVVKQGQKIAEMGKSGGVKTPQLHFEVRYKTKVVNPNHYLPK